VTDDEILKRVQDQSNLIDQQSKAIDEWTEIVNVYRSVFELIGDICEEELANCLSCRASRGISLNRIKEMAQTIIGKYEDEEYKGIY
jgi:hypothetical protein